MHIIYEVDSEDPVGAPIQVKIMADDTTIMLRQADNAIFIHRNAVSQLQYAINKALQEERSL